MKHLLPIIFFFSALLLSGGVFAQNQPAKVQVERESAGFTIQVNNTRVIVQNGTPRATVEVYSILGVKLKEYRLPSSGDDMQFELPKGCYILKSDNVVRKVAIK